MEIKDVGQRIAKLRKEKGLSQIELAKKLNVSDKTVSKWENGGMPGIDLFPEIANLFDVSIDYLMTGNGATACGETTEQETVEVKTHANYVCPKCGKLNTNPDTHCAYCYHEFDQSIMNSFEYVEEEEEAEQIVENDILYDANNKPICPKCGMVNPYIDTHCIYCYHEFKGITHKRNSRKSATATNKNYLSNTVNTALYNFQNSTQTGQLGCIAYFVAFLIPIAGLIWGATKKDKGVIIFSIVMMIMEGFSFLLWLIFMVIFG